MEEDQDFAYQLQQEALEASKRSKLGTEKEAESLGASTSGNPHIYRDPNDGTELEWDPAKKAWFPRISDDFIAQYQASYGNYEDPAASVAAAVTTGEHDKAKAAKPTLINVCDNPKTDTDTSELEASQSMEPPNSRKRAQAEAEPQWFEVNDEHNTNVYVSNLPLDITEEEFVELMKKCGMIMKDDRNQLKIRLYRDEMGLPKGDGRCCYIKLESVQLALNILDGYLFRQNTIKVERAKFSLKGQYDPAKKPKKRKSNKRDKEKQKKRMEKLFDWRPDKLAGERPKHEKVVIIRNMFHPSMFESDPRLILDYRRDLREECEEKCGSVRKVDIYDLHPEGIAAVTFNEFEDAAKCLDLMNGRFFAGRKLDVAHWDGKTKYKVKETEEEAEKRMANWDQFLEEHDHAPAKGEAVSS